MKHLSNEPEQLSHLSSEIHRFRNEVQAEWGKLPEFARKLSEENCQILESRQKSYDRDIHVNMPVIYAWRVVQSIYEHDLIEPIGIQDESWLDVIDKESNSVNPVRLREKVFDQTGIDLAAMPDFEGSATFIFADISELFDAAYPEGRLPEEQAT